MIITYGIKDEKICWANNKANSSYATNLEAQLDKGYTFVDVETDDEKFCNTDNLKVVDGDVVLDTEKIAQREKEALRQQYKRERDEALYSATIELDGMVFQTRPSDLSNFEIGIAQGQTKWILADNSIGTVTTAQLQQVMNEGIALCDSIWNECITKLESI